MKRICVVTGSRAEYGILRNLITLLHEDPEIRLELVVTGTHLEEKYGKTILTIKKDEIPIVKEIPMGLRDTTNQTITSGLAKLTAGLGEVFSDNHYDLLIILGDRYEMLAAANAAVIYQIPICHLHGGELTLGNYDEFIRHAITKMSHLHLASTDDHRDRIIQMGELPQMVYNIGSLGVENSKQTLLLTKASLENKLDCRLEGVYYVILFHPVTLDSKVSAKAQITALLEALQRIDKQCIFIGSNSDTGSDYIREACLAFIAEGDRHYYFPSLETQSYHSLVRYSEGLIGNSSSGLIEVPSLQRPSLNIGDRQKARTSGPSVIHCEATAPAILAGIKKLATVTVFDNPYEKPSSSYLAYQIITEKLEQGIAKQKPFYDRKEQVI